MNITKFLSATAFAFALLASPALSEDKHAACCEKSKAAGKECEHKCCVDAAKEKTVCEKCGGKKEEKKTT
jgi:hypothetical protein